MRILIFLTVILVTGCIGTDIVDYPLGAPPSHAEISEGSITLAATETYLLTFRLVANDGSTIPAEWQWSSRNNNVASVDPNGLVTANTSGQTWIEGTALMEFTDSVLVTVTSDPDDIASVTIEGETSKMSVGEMRQLNAVVRTASGDEVAAQVAWSSSSQTIVSVDENGLITANQNGSASITARAGDIISEPFVIEVGEESGTRTGMFNGRNGYNASGTASLEQSGTDAILKFSSDFTTQNGPGLYVYLSPESNGVNNALNLGAIQSTSGAQEYMLPVGSNPDLYDHVIIYCKPFGVVFAVASFE